MLGKLLEDVPHQNDAVNQMRKIMGSRSQGVKHEEEAKETLGLMLEGGSKRTVQQAWKPTTQEQDGDSCRKGFLQTNSRNT